MAYSNIGGAYGFNNSGVGTGTNTGSTAPMNTWTNALGIGAGAGAIGGGLYNLFGGGGNPADEAQKYYKQVPGVVNQNLKPYASAGLSQLPGLQNIFSQLMSDPNSVLKMLSGGYTQSPGYQWELGQGERAIDNAAAAGGMTGSPMHQQQAGELATNLANQDFDKYLQNVLGLFSGGISGSQGLFNTGYDASNTIADDLATALMNQGNLGYLGQQNQNQQQQSGVGDIFGGLGTIAGLLGI